MVIGLRGLGSWGSGERVCMVGFYFSYFEGGFCLLQNEKCLIVDCLSTILEVWVCCKDWMYYVCVFRHFGY